MATTTPMLPFDLRVAKAALAAKDERLARLIEETVEFQIEMESTDSPYEALTESITYQSISGKAAATIFARIKALGSNGHAPTPQEMLKLRPQKLRKAGLSGAKVLAMKDLAQKTIDGVVPSLEEAQKMSDEELVERLVSVRGIGAWTVEMFLIFRLGRPDVLPIHDYGVQKGFAILYRKKAMPKPRELTAFGERWRPYRTVASWYMWRAYGRAGKDARKITKNTAKKKRKKKKTKKDRPKKQSARKKGSRRSEPAAAS